MLHALFSEKEVLIICCKKLEYIHANCIKFACLSRQRDFEQAVPSRRAQPEDQERFLPGGKVMLWVRKKQNLFIMSAQAEAQNASTQPLRCNDVSVLQTCASPNLRKSCACSLVCAASCDANESQGRLHHVHLRNMMKYATSICCSSSCTSRSCSSCNEQNKLARAE